MSERDSISGTISRSFSVERRDVVVRFVSEASKVDEVTQVVAVNLGGDKLAPQPSILVIFDKYLDMGVISELRRSVCPDLSERDWVLGLVAGYTEEGFKEEMPGYVQRNHQIDVIWKRPQESASV